MKHPLAVSDAKKVNGIVRAVASLHNYCLKENYEVYCPPGYVDTELKQGDWRNETEPMSTVGRISSNNSSRTTIDIRDQFAKYFESKT